MAQLSIVCPDCGAVNRVPSERVARGESPICGKCGKRLFTGHPVALDDSQRFERHVQRSDAPVLVDFWAPWCGPCRMMAPEFEKAAERLEPRVRLAKVNTEATPALGARYGVQAIPTMILFHRGQEVARQSGAMPASSIVRFAEAHLAG
ncbi:MAG: thioredoxin TrxC [Propylenella sp.]